MGQRPQPIIEKASAKASAASASAKATAALDVLSRILLLRLQEQPSSCCFVVRSCTVVAVATVCPRRRP